MKTKKQKSAVMNRTNSFFGVTKGVEVVIKRIYFYNGEHYLKGLRLDNNEIVDLPYIFFDDIN